jgi:hypothetical protein
MGLAELPGCRACLKPIDFITANVETPAHIDRFNPAPLPPAPPSCRSSVDVLQPAIKREKIANGLVE